MNEIQLAVQTLLPPKSKQTPSGWSSFNAVCCHHRGESRDTRKRGGILLTPSGGFNYHCFNCNFKAGWNPGHNISKNTQSLFRWLGLSESDVNKLILASLQLKDQTDTQKKKILNLDLEIKNLPDQARPINQWIEEKSSDPNLLNTIDYILKRGFSLDDYNWHWSPANGYNTRVILPFYHQGQIVGWTGRSIINGQKPKYLTDTQPGYVFNLDNQRSERKFAIAVEGQFDAIAVDGCAIMRGVPNDTQIMRLNSLGKEIIVVPDYDRPGAKILNAALENNWSVSRPPWEYDIKDVADAVKRYGKLYTLFTILHYRETNKIKIQLLKKKLESLNV